MVDLNISSFPNSWREFSAADKFDNFRQNVIPSRQINFGGHVSFSGKILIFGVFFSEPTTESTAMGQEYTGDQEQKT